MTDYNDGKWHGFSGGKMPVHEQTEVECFFSDGIKNSGLAKDYSWQLDPDWIAFRVIKPYREAREFWIDTNKMLAYSDDHGEGFMHVREVLPTDPS